MRKKGLLFVTLLSVFTGADFSYQNPHYSFPGVHVLNATGVSNGLILNAIVSPSDASDKYVTFTTSDKSKVNFIRLDDDSIKVYAVVSFSGLVTITASISSYNAYCSCVYDNGGFSQS